MCVLVWHVHIRVLETCAYIIHAYVLRLQSVKLIPNISFLAVGSSSCLLFQNLRNKTWWEVVRPKL